MIKIDQAVVKGKSHIISLDNGDKFTLPEYIVFKYSLFSDKQFSDNEWQTILREVSQFKCHEKMMSLLSMRSYTEWKLAARLRRRGFSTSDIEYSIEQAKSTDLINDSKFAKDFIEEKRRYQDVRGKLKELKDLKDDGLISEEDYEVKKKELLNNF